MPGGTKYQVDPGALLLAVGEGITRADWSKDTTVFVQGGRSRCSILHPGWFSEDHDNFKLR